MTITTTGDALVNADVIRVAGNGIALVTGTAVIDGENGGFVETVAAFEVGTSGDGQLTLTGGASPVEVTVSDPGTPNDPASILVGEDSYYSGEVTISAGARLISRNNATYDEGLQTTIGAYQNVIIGNYSAGEVTVTGANSALLAYGTGARISVGLNQSSGTPSQAVLRVLDGGTVGSLSLFAGGYIHNILVTGAGSAININDTYGQYGGALATVAGGITLAAAANDTANVFVNEGGLIAVSNTDGVTDAPFVNIGRDGAAYLTIDGQGSALTVTQSGDAAAGGAFIGIGRDGDGSLTVSNGGQVSVTGDNAAISVAQTLTAGGADRSGQLIINSGGTVTIDSGGGEGGGLVIGQSANSGATVTVDGAGSLLSVISDAGATQSYGAFVTVGRDGNGSLAITNGGGVVVDANDDILPAVQIGYGAVTASVTVDGAGSTFSMEGNDTTHLASAGLMIVGRNAGSDGSLTISNGGAVALSQTNSLITVANEANSTGAITISGAGSNLTAGLITVSVDHDFNFGNPGANTATGGNGRIDLRTGGTLTAERLTIGDRGDADLDGVVTTDIELHGDLAFNGVADGALTLTGDLTVEQQGSLSITISNFANGSGDQLIINGDADFGALPGGVDLTVSTSDNFAAGDRFVFATVSGALTATTRVVADQNSGQTFTLSAENGQLILTANEAQIGDDGLFEGDETANLIDGGEGDDTMFGFGGDDTLLGGDEDDLLIGGGGADDLNGGDGFDFVSYEDASRRVQVDTANIVGGVGDAAGDTFTSIEGIIGTRFNDNLRGGNEDNDIQAGGFSDRLFGRGGDDTLDGGDGADAIFGNSGADEMTGGGGRDRFIYFRVTETGVGEGNRDVITDFDAAAGERMEIRRFDADTTQGFRQAFDFIGADAFSNTAGELRFDQSSGLNTIVQADTNGDGLADFEIELTGVITLTEAHFLI